MSRTIIVTLFLFAVAFFAVPPAVEECQAYECTTTVVNTGSGPLLHCTSCCAAGTCNVQCVPMGAGRKVIF